MNKPKRRYTNLIELESEFDKLNIFYCVTTLENKIEFTPSSIKRLCNLVIKKELISQRLIEFGNSMI